MSQTISRRTVLRAAGTVVALPFLEGMRATPPLAGQTKPAVTMPHRTAFFYVPNGMHMPDWLPEKTGESFALPATLQPLAEFRGQLNVLSGLTLDGARAHGDGPGDHARSVASFLTGAHPRKTDGAGIQNGISIDQLLAKATSAATARLPSLEIGMEGSAPAGRCDSGYSCVYTSNMSWRTATSPVAKEINPAALFDRIFGSRDDRQNREMAARRRRHRRSILDLVGDQARDLNRRLGTDDRRKLDEYLYAIREIERRLDGSDKLGNDEPDTSNFPRPAGVPRAWKDHLNLLLDVMTLAWQTDSTRIMTFMFGNAGSNRSYREIGVSQGHHDLSHHGNSSEKQREIGKINLYHMQLFASFVKRLQETPDGDGSLLDTSLLVYGSGIADGNRHAHDELPIITVGNGGGRYRTGRHIQFADETPLTNLYQTILEQSGAKNTRIGDSSGTLGELVARQ